MSEALHLPKEPVMLLVDYAREVVGMPMRGVGWGKHIGWTTDGDKADQMRSLGAHVTAIRSSFIGPVSRGNDPNRIIGYDVSFGIGRELPEEAAAA